MAQGYDAGAHTGEIGTFSLVPQIVDLVAGKVPVLAAGGVATGRHIAAALALGAEGVWMGTPWLTTKEHNTSPKMLDQLLNAGSTLNPQNLTPPAKQTSAYCLKRVGIFSPITSNCLRSQS